jgi:hypothetical protein
VRTLLIILLAIASVWLFTERMRLTDQVAALEEQLKKKEADLEDYVKQAQRAAARPGSASGYTTPSGGSPIAPPPKPGWINEHVEKGARSLDNPKRER